MAISFTKIPTSTIRNPGPYIEFDPSRANTGVDSARVLIVGQKTSAGTAPAGYAVLSEGVGSAATAFGAGSMLHEMIDTYRQNDPFGSLWVLPLDDDGAATAATGTITITGTATSAGTVAIYVAGVRYQVGVASGDTSIVVITKLLAALCNKTLPFTVTASTKVLALTDASNPTLAVDTTTVSITAGMPLTVTAKNKGLCGNDIQLALNFGGSLAGEIAPAGITVTFSAASLAGGATNPVLTTALANLGDARFTQIIIPYTDSVSLNAMQTFMDDNAGRWSYLSQLWGHVFTAMRGTAGALSTAGNARNDQHMSIIGFNGSPSPVWRWASAFGAQCAVSFRADCGIPVTAVPLVGIIAPTISNRFNFSNRNTLLYDGISTWKAGDDGVVVIDRVITTYQRTASGIEDNSMLDVETMFCSQVAADYLIQKLGTMYARKRLVSDTTRIADGDNTVSPSIIRAALIALYRDLELDGVVQNTAAFADAVKVEPAGGGVVKVWFPADLVGQLRVIAIQFSFTKST